MCQVWQGIEGGGQVMFVVGVSGVARSGKNLFCDMIAYELEQKGISSRQFALANELKLDCLEFLKEK